LSPLLPPQTLPCLSCPQQCLRRPAGS
jgi:hypothetical protein